MKQPMVYAILTCLLFGVLACRVDRGSRHSSNMDSQVAPKGAVSTSESSINSNSAPLASQSTSDNRPVIVCFGDSLTAGYGTDAGESYPDYLQIELDRRGYNYRVANEGISGNTTKDGAERVSRILNLNPRIVVVEFGGNDGLRGLPIKDSQANLEKIVLTLKGSGANVVLAGITLPPDYGPDYIRKFDTMYRFVAKKYRVPILPFLLQGVFGVPGMMQQDNTHATAEGNKIVARNVFVLISPGLRRD